MRSTIRVLALCLAGGLLAGVGFAGTNALANHQFNDVSAGSSFHDDIDWLTSNGIATGFPNGTFDPQGSIKRQQAAFWFSNYNSSIETITETYEDGQLPFTNLFILTATCPEGKRAIAGGGEIDQSINSLAEFADRPTSPSGEAPFDQWVMGWHTLNGTEVDPAEAQVTVVCAPLTLEELAEP